MHTTQQQVIIVWTSLCSVDPGDITETIAELGRENIRYCCTVCPQLSVCPQHSVCPQLTNDENIRVSIIGIGAELYIAKHVTEETSGQYRVAQDAQHLNSLLTSFVPPMPTDTSRCVLCLTALLSTVCYTDLIACLFF